jgi:hypothetical protein
MAVTGTATRVARRRPRQHKTRPSGRIRFEATVARDLLIISILEASGLYFITVREFEPAIDSVGLVKDLRKQLKGGHDG